MKLLYQVLFTVIICSNLGQAFFFRSVRSIPTTCKGTGTFCSDCNVIYSCLADVVIGGVSCKDVGQYCAEMVPGEATCQTVPTCPEESKATVIQSCKRVGRYPDPLNCGVYQQCSEINKKAVQYGCPMGTRFDPKKEICYKPTTPTAPGCISFNLVTGLCKNYQLKKIPHPIRPDMNVLCSNDYVPDACGSINEQFDPVSQKCVFSCQEEGFFADPDSKDNFYSCVKNGTKWIQIKLPCDTKIDSSKGFQFDPKEGICKAPTSAPPKT